MNRTTPSSPTSTAVDELVGLLPPEFAAVRRNTDAGYVDVLGDADPVGPKPGQQVFRTKLLPAIYERIWRPVVGRFFFGFKVRGKEERRITLEMLSVASGDRVIDVGCGPGNYTRPLADAAGDGLTVGIDASATMLAAAVKRGGGENLAYLRADAAALPFADGEFDSACSVGVIHMVENPMRAVREMTRILAPGGRLAIVVSWRKQPTSRYKGSVKIFGCNELTDALADHGLVDIEQRVVRRAQFVSARRPAE